MRFSLFDTTHYEHGIEPSSFNAEKAKVIFDQHLEEYTRAEQLGFDSIYLAEHHFSAYNLTPNPFLLLAALSQRTSRMRMGVMISVLTFQNPVRFAEEVAMLDLLTGGRLDVGIGRGVDEQEFIKFKMPYSEARPRFEEAVDLIMRLWSEQEVTHEGKYFPLESSSIWPRPIQQPHPPMWVAALSDATLQWAGRMGFGMSSAFLPPSITKNRFDVYREAAVAAGHAVTSEHTALLRFVHIADSEQQAIDEAESAMVDLFKLFIPAVVPKDLSALPEEYAYYKEFFAPFQDPDNPPPASILQHYGILIAGTAEQVLENVRSQIEESTTGHLLAWHHFGNLPFESVLHSEELFGRSVIPALQGLVPAMA